MSWKAIKLSVKLVYPPFFTSVTSKLINRLNIKDKTQRPKNYADRFSVGDFWREIYVTRLWKRCKNPRWPNLRVPSFVQKCPPEINIETNRRHFRCVNHARRALYYLPAYPTLEVSYPKRMSWL